ncbi:MAG: penicillin-binding transpeptidase domain-containing protein [Actinomycetia bacterium]|nr:penicillin-binding transpeptidase domain-containing protein [Actinomycetes bacterium]
MTNPVRLGVLGLVIIAFFAVLGLRLWTMQVTEAQAYEDRALSNQVRIVTTPAPRGDIFDANGVKLAGTRSALAAIVDLALVDKDDRESLAQNLAAFLDTPASEVAELFEASNQGLQITIAEDLSDAQATFLLEHRESFPGVNVVPQPIRTYPLGELGAHVIGYIGRPNAEDLEREDVKGNDFVGKAGVERSYDQLLRGTEGIVEYRVDAKRKVLALESEETPTAGGNLILTIDADVQSQLQSSLRDGLIQARRLEMEERREALSDTSIPQLLAEGLERERAEAAEAAAARSEADGTTSTTGDDQESDSGSRGATPEPINIEAIDVLGALYPGLPLDTNGVCVPVQRLTIPLGGQIVLSGVEPRTVRFDAVEEVGGRFLATVTVENETESVKNNQSFASTLQVLDISEERVILYHRDKWCPVRTVGVVENPNDGSIIAMASYPDFDPTAFVDGLSQAQWDELGTVSAFQNFAVQGLYAPASTFKTLPYVLALEESYYPLDRGVGDKEVGGETAAPSEPDDAGSDTGEDVVEPEPDADPVIEPLLTDTDEYSCTGEFKFQLNDGTVQTKRDWKWPGGHGPLDLHGALQASCDLYFWDIALRLWNERSDESGIDKENLLQEYARGFGFGTATGIDLPFERDGLVPDRAWFKAEQREGSPRVRADGSWVGGDLMDFAVGQGATLTTPLQMANSLAAMVNGGTVWTPRVVDEVVDQDGNVITENPPLVARTMDLDPRTGRMLLADLQQVVNNQDRGTARSAFQNFGPGVELIGGKTGTSEIIKAPRAQHYKQVDSAFFVGVAPITNPEWVVSVVVERGGSGGRVAAPVARQVFQFLMNGEAGVTELAPGLDAD